jgi:hypothetical protein
VKQKIRSLSEQVTPERADVSIQSPWLGETE